MDTFVLLHEGIMVITELGTEAVSRPPLGGGAGENRETFILHLSFLALHLKKMDSMDVSLRELPGDGDGQGGLACCDSWGRKESTRLSHCTELN